MREAWIVDFVRSARGRAKPDGALHDLSPLELLEQLLASLRSRNGFDPGAIDELVLGCVTQAGEQAGNIAKAALLHAGWPDTVPGLTVHRYCASGLDALNVAAMKVQTGQARLAIGGGVEMMSRVPMLSDRAAIFSDPAVARRCRMLLMGNGADLIASLGGYRRDALDAVALNSHRRAEAARREGRFRGLVSIHNPIKGIDVVEDECIRPATTAESLAALPAAFAEPGAAGADAMQLAVHDHLGAVRHLHTAGNSPAMADAAALLLVADADTAAALGRPRRARIAAALSSGDDPLQVVAGCIPAVRRLLDRQGLAVGDIDLFEIHEAFAATILRCQEELDIDDARLNVNGGVIALGHPLGATGAIMAGTLLEELERRDLELGVVAVSGAGGSGSAMLVSRQGGTAGAPADA